MPLALSKFPPSRLGVLIEPKFIFGRHLAAVEETVVEMYGGDGVNNYSIQLPIRHSKSTYAATLALRILCENPAERIIIAAFSLDAASEILAKVSAAVQMWGPQISGIRVDPKMCRSDYFRMLGTGGECRAVSIGTKFSHATANTIICDDLYTEESVKSPVQRKTIEDWFFGTLLNRRTKSARGAPKIICTMTPRHPEDVLANIEASNPEAAPEDRWVIHRQPCILDDGSALFPELWPLDALERKRKELEDADKGHIWQTVWMLNPQLGGDHSFSTEWLPHYGQKAKGPKWENLWYTAEARPWIYENSVLKVVCADCSISGYGDFTAIVTIHVVQHSDKSLHLYLDNHFRKQCYVPDARAALSAILLRNRPDAASCEATGFQRLIAYDANDEVAKQGFLAKIRPFEPPQAGDQPKIDIALRLSDILAEGRLHLFHCPENVMLRAEAVAFPWGDHDDSLDAVRQAVHLVNEILFA
jgi:hypothetical protein